MSFDLFAQFYEHGAPAAITVDAVRAAFGSYVATSDATHWRLEYDTENRSYIDLSPHPSDHSAITGFTVNRPCGDLRLWDGLAAVLCLGNAVLYFPGGRNPLVGSTDAVPHLPPDMIEALGSPVVVTTGQAILAQLNAV